MFLVRLQEFLRFCPVFDAPVGKIPRFHVVVALVVHIEKRAVHRDEIGGEVVDIGVGRVEPDAKFLHLGDAPGGQTVLRHQAEHRVPVDVFFEDALVFTVYIQQFGHGDADGKQPLIVIQLGLQLVAKLVVGAGFVVDLLEDITLTVPHHQVGVASLALAQQAEHGIFHAVDRHDLHQKPPRWDRVSEATLLPSFIAAMMSPSFM